MKRKHIIIISSIVVIIAAFCICFFVFRNRNINTKHKNEVATKTRNIKNTKAIDRDVVANERERRKSKKNRGISKLTHKTSDYTLDHVHEWKEYGYEEDEPGWSEIDNNTSFIKGDVYMYMCRHCQKRIIFAPHDLKTLEDLRNHVKNDGIEYYDDTDDVDTEDTTSRGMGDTEIDDMTEIQIIDKFRTFKKVYYHCYKSEGLKCVKCGKVLNHYDGHSMNFMPDLERR